MKHLCLLLLFLTCSSGVAHPGGGIVALSENSALIADPTENFIWLVATDVEPKKLVSKFHGHWMTRGRDSHIYVEAFGESGGAWSSAAFRLDIPTGNLIELAHRDELNTFNFAVDEDGSFIFKRDHRLVSRKNRTETPFRPWVGEPNVQDVTAYAWTREGDLIFADRNTIWQLTANGAITKIAQIAGKVPEPKIWNATDTPAIFGLAIDKQNRVLATLPHLAKAYRIEKKGELHELPSPENNWRATGVDVFNETIFLTESNAKASTSPRVRILRPSAQPEILTLPRPSQSR